MHRSALLLVLLAVWAESAKAEGLALIVGVNECPEFRLPDGSKPRPLLGAEHDARRMAELLVSRFGFVRERITLLVGSAATRAKLQAALDELSRVALQGDSVVFYYAGHGTQCDDQKPWDEDDDLDEGLALADATAQGENLLVDDELGRWLAELKARDVTVLLDCCHAGSGTKQAEVDIVPRYLPIAPQRRRPKQAEEPWREMRPATKDLHRRTTAFFACQAHEQAYERRAPIQVGKPTSHVGQFSHYLLEGLTDLRADSNRDGRLTNRELLNYVGGQLDERFNVHRPERGLQQHPQIESDANDGLWLGGATAR